MEIDCTDGHYYVYLSKSDLLALVSIIDNPEAKFKMLIKTGSPVTVLYDKTRTQVNEKKESDGNE